MPFYSNISRPTRGRTPPTPMYSDAESSSQSRESSEPTISGFEPSYEQIDRHSKLIVAHDREQFLAFKTIQAIHPTALEPYGFLPTTKNPRTGHYDWLRRTQKGIVAMVWCRINSTASDVIFEVTLHTDDILQVHVPLDSWRRRTCDSEAVRASIQQAYLDLLRGHSCATVVKPGMKCLRFMPRSEYEDAPRYTPPAPKPRYDRSSYPVARRATVHLPKPPHPQVLAPLRQVYPPPHVNYIKSTGQPPVFPSRASHYY